MERRLLVLRHAKSSWDDPGLADHDRPLAPRGERALTAIREAVEEHATGIEVVLCSSAARAVATLDGVRDALPASADVTVDRSLYGADRRQWLGRCRRVSDDVAEVLLVGHNPALEGLVRALTATGEPDALEQLARKYPTGALAVLVPDGPWSRLDEGSCHLAALPTPKRWRRRDGTRHD